MPWSRDVVVVTVAFSICSDGRAFTTRFSWALISGADSRRLSEHLVLDNGKDTG